MKQVAVSLASAKAANGNLAVEKYISVNNDDGGLYISAVKVISAYGGRPLITNGALFIAHTHAVDLPFPNGQGVVGASPGPGDSTVVKRLGIPNYVVSYKYNANSFSLRNVGIVEVGESLNGKGIGREAFKKIK